MFEDLTPQPPAPEPGGPESGAAENSPAPPPAERAPQRGEGESRREDGPENPEPPAEQTPAEPAASETGSQAANVIFEDQAEDEDEDASSELSDWKAALRRDFEEWLATIKEVPGSETGEETEPETEGEMDELAELDEPDLYSFYEQMAAANAETRKANRRTAEALNLWGDTLARFDGDLAQLREYFRRLSAAAEKSEALPRATSLILIEVLDRARRLALALETPPPKSRWWNDSAWRRAWDAQRRGLEILTSHLESLLKAEGVTRIEALGRPFDPRVMVAITTEPDSQKPHHTVIEEITAGYLHHGELLRPVQVRVTLNPSQK